jgi:uncharacterized protein YerC
MKLKFKHLTKQEIIITLDTLYTAASVLHGRQAMKLFLRDLLTPSERIMLGRRIIIARLLIAGKTHYEIKRKMGVGKKTIRNIQRWLDDQFPGFERAVAQMEKEFKKRGEKRLYATSSLYRLKKKYPLYYLFLPQQQIKNKRFLYPARNSKTNKKTNKKMK